MADVAEGGVSAGLRRFAWANVLYNLAVILWGAYVRATGSGAGCGDHWPICNGQVIPRDPSLETIIEFTHRLTSGVALVGVVVLFIWARKTLPRHHLVRSGAKASVVLMIIEALLGAGLVLFRLVADDTSTARAVAMALHLANTLLLVGAMTLTAWWASGGKAIRLRGQGLVGGLLIGAHAGVMLLGTSGALAALGSTLYPEVAGLEAHLAPTAHILLKLSVLHPMLALVVGGYLLAAVVIVALARNSATTRRLAAAVIGLYLLQVGAGVTNIYLQAPVWLQLVHLLLADLIWIALVCLAADALARTEGSAAPHEVVHPVAAL
ncbi:COX15/CtaA family protein [Vulgatibacter sp.]|uniref:COX15/CtaA family protein n=1 Tax=Vulgatibacter sp. TaxID=1971226 RepID=UPI0035640C48